MRPKRYAILLAAGLVVGYLLPFVLPGCSSEQKEGEPTSLDGQIAVIRKYPAMYKGEAIVLLEISDTLKRIEAKLGTAEAKKGAKP